MTTPLFAKATAEAGVETGELPSAADVIDQLVVDGYLTEPGDAVGFDTIIAPVLGPMWRTDPRLQGVLDGLYNDPRCQGFHEDNGFMFRPETSPGCKVVKPSWRAVVAGKARYAPTDYIDSIVRAMQSYAEVIYNRHSNRQRPVTGVVPVRELWGMLWWQRNRLTEQGAAPNAPNFAAFKEFIKLNGNGYFISLPDERVVLVNGVFNGQVDQIEPLKPVRDMQGAVVSAVGILGPRGLAMPSLILRTIEDDLGLFTTPAQQAMLKQCMLNIPGVEPRGRDSFRIGYRASRFAQMAA